MHALVSQLENKKKKNNHEEKKKKKKKKPDGLPVQTGKDGKWNGQRVRLDMGDLMAPAFKKPRLTILLYISCVALCQ